MLNFDHANTIVSEITNKIKNFSLQIGITLISLYKFLRANIDIA